MLIPNLIVAIFSFNDPVGRFNYQWNRFSTDAWTKSVWRAGHLQSVGLSLRIGITASLVATVLGTMIAFALGGTASAGGRARTS